MSRKRDDKARSRRPRSHRSRDRDKRDTNAPDDLSWLLRGSVRNAAMKIINSDQSRPYVLSIPHDGGVEPVAGYYPCSMMRRNGRIYYAFLFREHRDAVCDQWPDAIKEYTR